MVLSSMIRRAARAVCVQNKFSLLPRPRPPRGFVSSYCSSVFSNPPETIGDDPYDLYYHPGFLVDSEFEDNQRGYCKTGYYSNILSVLVKKGYATYVLFLAQKYFDLEDNNNNNNNNMIRPDIDTWKILITCHCREGTMFSAVSLFNKIIKANRGLFLPCLDDIFDGFCRLDQIHNAMLFYKEITACGINFKLSLPTYFILIRRLCELGEMQMATDLLRRALQIDLKDSEAFDKMCLYNSVIGKLCKDRLVTQANDLCSEIFHLLNISPNSFTYLHLIYGHCILSQFKQAIALFHEYQREEKKEEESTSDPVFKSVVAVLIKAGVRPDLASYHLVVDRLYKIRSPTIMNNIIAQKLEEWRNYRPHPQSWTIHD